MVMPEHIIWRNPRRQEFQRYNITSYNKNYNITPILKENSGVDCKNKISGAFFDYSSRTSVHGIQYLGEKHRYLIERLFWICVIGLSFFFCSRQIVLALQKWNDNPVILSFMERPMGIRLIPFPAVTICPMTKARKKFFNYSKVYQKIENNTNKNVDDILTEEELKYFNILAPLCNPEVKIKYGRKSNKTFDVVGILDEIAPLFNESIVRIVWNKEHLNASDVFFKTVNEMGICYTFNGINPQEMLTEIGYRKNIYKKQYERSDWLPDRGYTHESDMDVYPRRVFAPEEDLVVDMIGLEKDFDYLCGESIQGFDVSVHSPRMQSLTYLYSFRVAFDKEVTVTLSPNVIVMDPSLETVAPERRQCYYSTERSLRFFRFYTQKNCQAECFENITIKMCQCASVGISVPLDIRICTFEDDDCCKDATTKFRTMAIKNGYSPKNTCKCLPDCVSITYDTDVSYGDFAVSDITRDMHKIDFVHHHARLRLKFKNMEFFAMKRSELYGTMELLANCGGLLGLFMGISVLSFVEIFYFSTIRPIVTICNRLRGNHS